MKKHKITALLAVVCLLGLLGGCGQTGPASAEPEGPATVEGPNALTAEEIERVNEAFADFVTTVDGVEVTNSLLCLLSCYYAAPEDIDLSAFLAYCFVTEEVSMGQELEPVGQTEFEALKQQADWPFQSAWAVDEMIVPIHRYPRVEVDAFLERHTGVATADLAGQWAEKLFYVPEYDAYYNYTSDFGPGRFECQEGVREGSVVRLTGKGRPVHYVPPMGTAGVRVEAQLTVEEQPDGTWRFVSYLPLDETGAVTVPERADPNALTAEEIQQVNEAFAATYTVDRVTYATQISCFFTSYYERPEDIDFREFMYLFSPGEVLPDDSEELQALSRLEDWPHTGYFEPDALPCPTHKFRRADVDAALQKYMGITTADLTHVNDNGPTLLYLEEYDAYYNFTSDFGPGTFRCVSGRRDGDRVILTGDWSELTLEQQPDGSWYFVSHLPLEKEQ
ncbi:hypothetical protein [uncultured Dysosmobacter sp.]|uniref:hypothetical protein n=1 Tax=uncultured Dysosmobacter sp. TaxID=2591384 RepID=UPI002629F2A8|nr:hypothetical protein [uncultured Dysosmobacter sp.]